VVRVSQAHFNFNSRLNNAGNKKEAMTGKAMMIIVYRYTAWKALLNALVEQPEQ
jgi:hypothetical protein